MEALSPRSTNVQLKPRTIKKKDVVDLETRALAKKFAADAEAKKAKEKDFAPPPPDWVIQPPQKEGMLSEKYKTGRLLGKGGFAICYEGELQQRGKKYTAKYALKIVKAKMNQRKMEEKVNFQFPCNLLLHNLLTIIVSSVQSSKYMPKCAILI